MAKRIRYDDKFRASALAVLEAAGYPENRYKLEEVARHLNVPTRTLRRWYDGVSNPVSDELVQEEKKDLKEQLRSLAQLITSYIPKTFEDSSLQELSTALGIVVDKMRLLESQPTAITESRDGISDTERANRITRILDAARTRRDGRADNGDLQH